MESENKEQTATVETPGVRARFVGSGGEYFRIWIVNVLLSIVTLGIYSPWATVRNRRYLYGNTDIDGQVFDFHGEPIAILKGRLIAVAVLVVIYFGEFLHVLISSLTLLAVMFLYPWILVAAMRFRLSNTSYRGLRFGFDATVGHAYKRLLPVMLVGLLVMAYFLFGIEYLIPAMVGDDVERQYAAFFEGYLIAMIAAVLIVPLFVHRVRDLLVNFSRFGKHSFRANLKVSQFWGVYGWTLLSGLIVGIVAAIAVTALIFSTVGPSAFELPTDEPQAEYNQPVSDIYFASFQDEPQTVPESESEPDPELGPGSEPELDTALLDQNVLIGIGLMYLLIIPLYLFPFAVWHCGTLNYSYNQTRIEDVKPNLTLNPWRYWGIMVTNGVLAIVTIGLAIPWAKVRMMRYQLSCLTLQGNLDQFTSGERKRTTATGEELGGALDFDLGF